MPRLRPTPVNPPADISERVVLVDGEDRKLGSAPKQAVHLDGSLHRAFSVFVFDGAGNTLLQRRAATKYHSGGLWSNTCCGHPRPGETTGGAARRRLREEMGFDCALHPALSFLYKRDLENGLIEHELDHVLVGQFDGTPVPNPEEVEDWRWAALSVVATDMIANPPLYSVWFPIALAKLYATGMSEVRRDVMRRTG
jgi:isopentenyl-diphosphate delta-isomerase